MVKREFAGLRQSIKCVLFYHFPHDEGQINKSLKNVNPKYDQYCYENALLPSCGGAEAEEAENDKIGLQSISVHIERKMLP